MTAADDQPTDLTDTLAEALAPHMYRHDGACECDASGTRYASRLAWRDHVVALLAAALVPVLAQREATLRERIAAAIEEFIDPADCDNDPTCEVCAFKVTAVRIARSEGADHA